MGTRRLPEEPHLRDTRQTPRPPRSAAAQDLLGPFYCQGLIQGENGTSQPMPPTMSLLVPSQETF